MEEIRISCELQDIMYNASFMFGAEKDLELEYERENEKFSSAVEEMEEEMPLVEVA